MKTRTQLLTLLTLVLLTVRGSAQTPPPLIVTITPIITSSQTVTFYGALTNNSIDALLLDPFTTIEFNELDPGGNPYFTQDAAQPTLPASVGAGTTTGSIPLFSLDVAGGTPLGAYTGQFVITGTDSATATVFSSAQNSDGSLNPTNGAFTLTLAPVPEPASPFALGFGALAVACLALRQRAGFRGDS